MLPMTKAPKALLKPAFVDTTAMKQQRPSDTMRSVSDVMRLRVERRKRGMAKMPTTNHNVRKNPMRTTDISIAPLSGLSPVAMADSMTIMTIARISSRISTLMTSDAKRCWRSPRSSKALYMIVVDDMASMPPRNILLMSLHENMRPTL